LFEGFGIDFVGHSGLALRPAGAVIEYISPA
jgi:hypothetical protein